MRKAVFLGSLLVVFGSPAWAQAPAEPSAPAATPAPVVSPAPPPGAPSRDPATSAESPAATTQPPAVVVAPAPPAAPTPPPAVAVTPAPAPAPAGAAPAAPSAPAPALAAGPAAPARLLGIGAWSQVVGNTITGREEGKLLTEFYAPDGSIKSMHGNELSAGQWALVGETVCVRYSGDPATECYRVEVSGDSATFYDKAGSGTRYRILKGNPRNL